MKRIIAWFASNHVAANLLMAVILVGGFVVIPTIPQKAFPDIDIDMVSIDVEYRGAAPEEVEEGACVRIEEAVDGVDGIEKIHSTASEGACSVMAELVTGADVKAVRDEIENRVDALDTLPEETEKPVVSKVTMRRPVLDIAVSGRADERTLKVLGRRLRDDVAALPGVTQVDLDYVRPYEIAVEVPEASLRRHGLTFDQVVEAVRRSSLDLPGGSIKTQGGEILLRTKDQAYRGPDFERIVVLTRPDGTRVTLGQIGEVIDGFEESDVSTRFDGEPAVMVRVYRVGDQDVIDIVDRVRSYVEEARALMPEGIKLTIWRDGSQELRGRIATLFRNGRAGLLLVLAALTLFLRPRLALWVSAGVPTAVLGAVAAFPMLGITINVVSTFAFIMVLGILVDDAIVVAENVYTLEQRCGDRQRAAIEGTQEVAVPVIFGVLTTVVAFCPIFFIEGPMRQVFSVMAIVVIACLLFSVLESQLVLPAHLSQGRTRRTRRARNPWMGRWLELQDWFSEGLVRFARETYHPFLLRALEWRYLTLATGVAVLCLALGLVGSGRMRFSFFPEVEADYVSAALTMPQGTPIQVTREAVRRLQAGAEATRADLDPRYAPPGKSLIRHVLASSGTQPLSGQQHRPGTIGRAPSGSHLGEVVLELVPSEQREISTRAVAQRWRERTGAIPDAVELTYSSALFSAGEAVNIQLHGAEVPEIRSAAEALEGALAGYPGVSDIRDSFRSGKREIELSLLPEAEPLGVTARDLARQVRQAFYGEEAQRIQRGRDDLRVMVRYPADERRSLGDLEDMRIRTPTGAEVPLGTVARAELGRGFASIRRTDHRRVINVTADLDQTVTTADELLANLTRNELPRILADHPGIRYSLEGEQEAQRKAFGGLGRAYLVALLAIFALLAVPLRSYVQPLIIMSVIPFGVVGAVIGHLIMGRSFSFMSVIGIVALAGVVVNASLVLVDYVNRRRAEGMDFLRAVEQAGVARFRPIVLTSLTTFLGLTPLMLERSLQAQFLIPMAISLAFGVVFSTGITLLLVPCGYLVIEDLRARSRRLREPAPSRVPESQAFPSR